PPFVGDAGHGWRHPWGGARRCLLGLRVGRRRDRGPHAERRPHDSAFAEARGGETRTGRVLRGTAMKNRRGASAEEHALFQNAVKDAKPRAKRERVTHTPKSNIPFMVPYRAPHIPVFPDVPAAPIGGHVEARLRRGRGDVEARIDLHGHTHDGAYRAL